MSRTPTRTTLEVQRVSLASLIKVQYFAGLGVCVPFCVLAALIGLFAPNRVRMRPGETMGDFAFVLIMLIVFWPALYAVLFGCASWAVFGIKGLFSDTKLEIIQRTKGEGQEPNKAPEPTPTSVTPRAAL